VVFLPVFLWVHGILYTAYFGAMQPAKGLLAAFSAREHSVVIRGLDNRFCRDHSLMTKFGSSGFRISTVVSPFKPWAI
jgi:hypothetical protein